MNVSSETLVFPVNHHQRRILNKNHSTMFLSASPIAVNNKIRAIQTRKSRITLPSYYDYTDIRALNIANNNGLTNSSGTFSNLSPEKLLERSRELRLGRISARQNPRPSVLSTISTANQQSLILPNYNLSNGSAKQPQVNSPTALAPPMNKSSIGNIPDIHQRSNRVQTTTRQPLIEEQNILISVETRNKSLPKTKSSIPKAYNRTVSKSKSSFPTSHAQPLLISPKNYSKQLNTHIIPLCKSEEIDENIPVKDGEFEEYLQKAIVKCADWLIKYVFDKKYDENDE